MELTKQQIIKVIGAALLSARKLDPNLAVVALHAAGRHLYRRIATLDMQEQIEVLSGIREEVEGGLGEWSLWKREQAMTLFKGPAAGVGMGLREAGASSEEVMEVRSAIATSFAVNNDLASDRFEAQAREVALDLIRRAMRGPGA